MKSDVTYYRMINGFSLAQKWFQPCAYFVILTSLHEKSDVIRVQASQVLETSPVVTPMYTRAFCINGVWCWMLLPQLSKEKTNYIIKQLSTIEVLDMALISTIEYQYWPRLSPRSTLVFSSGYHGISNTSIVNNCIMASDFRQYIAEYNVVTVWRHPIRRGVIFASALCLLSSNEHIKFKFITYRFKCLVKLRYSLKIYFVDALCDCK